MQAALGAGQKEQASNALQGWLHSLAGGADAAMALGGGGRVNVKELQAELLVSFEHSHGSAMLILLNASAAHDVSRCCLEKVTFV